MIFRFLNVNVRILPTFWVFLLFFAYEPNRSMLQMGVLGLVLFLSLLIHEFGHALAALKFGKEPEVVLEGIGGYASYDGRGMSDKEQFIVTLCGPLFTGILIGLSWYLVKMSPCQIGAVRFFFYAMMKLNVWWLIVNLAPLLPLDGGKMALFGLRKWLGFERGGWWALLVGNGTALAGALYFMGCSNYLFAGLFLMHGWRNYQLFVAEKGRGKQSEFALYNEAIGLAQREEGEKAKAILEKLSRSKDDYIRVRAAVALANLLERMGNQEKAYQTLEKVDAKKLDEGKLLLCKLAFMMGNYRLVERHSIEIYEMHPTFDVALLNAKTFACLNNGVFSAAWLGTALLFDEGKAKGVDLIQDPAFDGVKDHPEFQKLAESFTTQPQI